MRRMRILFLAVLLCLLLAPRMGLAGALIIDHRCTDIERIPPVWIERAKALTMHYAHTSHGSQINTGVLNLESQDAAYSIAIRTNTTPGLPAEEDSSAMRLYDGTTVSTYATPECYWYSADGINSTRTIASTGDYQYSMWSWCGQVDYYSDAQIQTYLDTMDQFETEYPNMRFIYMTGHLEGTGSSGTLHRHNEMIRTHCRENGKVLFDFADIERYNPDGVDFLDQGADDNCDYDSGNWALEWCAANPGSDLCASCSCAHSQALNCNRKARAFWWMMARLAGWPGPGTNEAARILLLEK